MSYRNSVRPGCVQRWRQVLGELTGRASSVPASTRTDRFSPCRLDYTWIDANRKPVKLAAPVYIDFVFTWGQHLLDDPTSFPVGVHDFPENYVLTCKHLYRQLLRVFAHIYHAHFEQLLHLCSEPHFNSLFAHFLSFGTEFEILDMRDLRGSSSALTGIGQLYDTWKRIGIVQ